MPDTHPLRARAPWLAAAVLAVLAAGAALTVWGFILPDRSRPVAAFTGAQSRAMDAASIEAVNILSYSRKSYDADVTRALTGATGELRTDLKQRRDDTRSALTKGKFDLAAKVRHVALERVTDKGVLVLVDVDGYKVTGSTRSAPVPQRLEMTMVRVDGKWLASDVTAVDLT